LFIRGLYELVLYFVDLKIVVNSYTAFDLFHILILSLGFFSGYKDELLIVWKVRGILLHGILYWYEFIIIHLTLLSRILINLILILVYNIYVTIKFMVM
jgi:hypothetical protein